jgi:predicted protein tyrosine phosphatase
MIIKIHSAESIIKLAQTPFPPGTALISISDPDDEPLVFLYEPEHILRMQFEDISIEELSEDDLIYAQREKRIFTKKQAEIIAEFILPLKYQIDILICQCYYGQSRSAGVAAAISQYFYSNGIDIFADYKYTPNKSVYNKIIEALRKKGRQV